mgnify:CR=1 FL=1
MQTLIIESLENSGKIVAVGRESVGLRADYILQSDLREFQAELDSRGGAPFTALRPIIGTGVARGRDVRHARAGRLCPRGVQN